LSPEQEEDFLDKQSGKKTLAEVRAQAFSQIMAAVSDISFTGQKSENKIYGHMIT